MISIIKESNIFIIALVIFSCCLLAYYPVYSAGFIWDDDDYIINNPNLRNIAGLWQIWFKPSSLPQYYPLVHSTFWLEFQLWGLSPFGYHLNNVLLHSFNAVLVYKILKHIRISGALFAALIFALHPVHVESVAWVTERKNVLSALFYLLSIWYYFKWRPLSNKDSISLTSGILAFILFICALLSKSVACSLPAVILLIVYLKNARINKSDILCSIPFFAVGIISAIYTSFLEKSHVLATGKEFDIDFIERVLIASRAVWFYIQKLLIPYPLSFNYERWEVDATSFGQWLYFAALFAVLFSLFYLRKKIGRGPLVAALFFGGTIIPALGFINIYPMRYSFVADHFQYVASLGPICLFAAGFSLMTKYFKNGNRLGLMFSAFIIVALGFLTFNQSKIYKGHEELWRDTIEKNPLSWFALNNLAKTLIDKGQPDEAGLLLTESIKIRPSFEAHLNQGSLEYAAGRNQSALNHFENAIQLKPYQSAPYNNKAFILMQFGKYNEALEFANKSLNIDGLNSFAFATRGQILYRLNRMREAYKDLSRSIELNPNNNDILFYLGDAAYINGDLNASLKWSANALSINNNNDEIIELFSKALIQSVLQLDKSGWESYCMRLYTQIGNISKPAFKTLVDYLKKNDMGAEAQRISYALKL